MPNATLPRRGQPSRVTTPTKTALSTTSQRSAQDHPGTIIQRAQVAPSTLTAPDLLSLQRTIGNHATTQLLHTNIQRKPLTLGPVNDQYEQEADRIASQVSRQTSSQLTSNAPRPTIQRQTNASTSSDPEGGEVDTSIQQQIQQTGGGAPLQDDVRRQMEGSFGTDFSGVRVHTDANADSLNRDLQARAFTTGRNIFFKRGEYNPGTQSGKQLLAHELTHTIQQNAVQPSRDVSAKPNTKSGTRGIIQAKFLPATKKMPWVRIYSGTTTPDTRVKQASINHLFSRTLEVDPNQTSMIGNVMWVRARVMKSSGTAQNEGWIKWSDVQWADDVNPELQHQIGDKFFGLASPSSDQLTNELSGYGVRKTKALTLYHKQQQDDTFMEGLAPTKWHKKKSAKRKLLESKLAIGKKLADRGFSGERSSPQPSNEHFINTMDNYLSIPTDYFSMYESGIDPMGIDTKSDTSWKSMLGMHPQDRQMMASIKRDTNWTSRQWFTSSGSGRDTGHRSKMALRATIRTGHHVHFLLDGVDMNVVVDPSENYYNAFTCKELRHLYRYWDQYRDGVTFWRGDRPVPPPWDENPSLWRQFDTPTRRESLID